MDNCSVCKKEIDGENAPILAMGGFGNPRYLCDECAREIESATTSRNVSEIEKAMAALSEKLAGNASDDALTVKTVTEIFEEAGERAKKIKDGTYDFSEDDSDEEEEFVLDEELTESEEDAILDERDAEKAKKIDKIFNIITAAVFGAAVIAFIIFMLTR